MANPVGPPPIAGAAPSDEQINRYVDAVAATMPQKVQDALAKVKPTTRMLALQRYVSTHAQGQLESKWVWDAKQIHEFNEGGKGLKVNQAAKKVTQQFEAANPGYTLGTSPLRDIDRQVRLWNHNPALHASATEASKRAADAIARLPDQPDLQSLAQFRAFLAAMKLENKNTSAAPGLSDHGQMHAIDFVVIEGKNTVAGTVSGKAGRAEWDPKWRGALRDAVVAANGELSGGVTFKPDHLGTPGNPGPYEPWHYTLAGKPAAHH